MSKIEWTDEVWNPIAGCTVKSSGCDNCYAMRQAYRLEKMHVTKYNGTARKNASGRTLWTGKINFDEKALLKPLSWKKPRMIFINSMSDLFHENVRDEWIDQIFAVMALCPQHTFQILTKRPERMRDYLRGDGFKILDEESLARPSKKELLEGPCSRKRVAWSLQRMSGFPDNIDKGNVPWPLKNVRLGVSVEDQKTADDRIPLLLDTPAAVRFISAEPLLGEIDLIRVWARMPSGGKCLTNTLRETREDKLDWVIVGGESGPNARPMHPEWARLLRDQCKGANVPFFFKQWGMWAPVTDDELPENFGRECDNFRCICSNGFVGELSIVSALIHRPHRYPKCFPDGEASDAACESIYVRRFGKKKAGFTLDGEVIQQMPGDV